MNKGRPTLYGEEILEKAREYRDIKRPTEDEVIPSIEGLALYIGITRTTIYDWISQEEKKDFSYIVSEILSKQAKTLVNKGLEGKFNSSITKVLLTKHGYREGIEQTGKDGKDLSVNIVSYGDNTSAPLSTQTVPDELLACDGQRVQESS